MEATQITTEDAAAAVALEGLSRRSKAPSPQTHYADQHLHDAARHERDGNIAEAIGACNLGIECINRIASGEMTTDALALITRLRERKVRLLRVMTAPTEPPAEPVAATAPEAPPEPVAEPAPEIPTERCLRCGAEYPFTSEYFGRNSNSRSGLRRVCRACNHVVMAAAGRKNRRAPTEPETSPWTVELRPHFPPTIGTAPPAVIPDPVELGDEFDGTDFQAEPRPQTVADTDQALSELEALWPSRQPEPCREAEPAPETYGHTALDVAREYVHTACAELGQALAALAEAPQTASVTPLSVEPLQSVWEMLRDCVRLHAKLGGER